MVLALIVIVLLTVGFLVAIFIAAPITPYKPLRYEGVVVNAVCTTDQDSAVVFDIYGTERTFDALLRDCALADAHVGDVLSFEISPGGTWALNFAVVEVRA